MDFSKSVIMNFRIQNNENCILHERCLHLKSRQPKRDN